MLFRIWSACVVVAYSEVEDQLDHCLCDQLHRGPSTKLPPTARSSAAAPSAAAAAAPTASAAAVATPTASAGVATPTASAGVASPAVAAIPAVSDPGRKDA